jgi:hypothetical protein
MEKVYHIYAKDRCLFHSLREEEFHNTWKTLNNIVGLMKTDYSVEDLSFIELPANIGGVYTSLSTDPPGSPSY